MYYDLFYVPVYIPLFHVVVAPSLHHVTHSQVDTDQAVRGDAQHLILSATLKPVGQKTFILINLIQGS